MKRLVALAVGAFGVRALLRRSRSGGPEPADELRAKLAETRTVEEPAAEATAADEPLDGVEARRADVHARARRTIDDLSS